MKKRERERKAFEAECEELKKEFEQEIAIIDEKLENASKDNLSAEEHNKLLDRKEQLLWKIIAVLYSEIF